jgi:tetraacyldisaccharide 4'-kinase
LLSDLRRAIWDEEGAQPRAWLRPALWPAALAYRGAVAGWSRWGLAVSGGARQLPVPVLSVGNLVIGGTGKTPHAMWMAQTLIHRGRSPAILARGYGGRAGRGPLVVSDGREVMCGPDEAGDETVLIARRLPTVPVVAGSDRYLSGMCAVEHLGADCAILDDGFQHISLCRDLNVLLLDSTRPLGNGRLFPLGSLREPPSALTRADIVIFTRWSERRGGDSARMKVVTSVGERRIAATSHVLTGLYSLSEGREVESEELKGMAALLVTGIANPRSFENTVVGLGVEVREHLRFPDHHKFALRDLMDAKSKARSCGAGVILTTQKDSVRLPRAAKEQGPPLVQVEIAVKIEDGEEVITLALDRMLAEARKASKST